MKSYNQHTIIGNLGGDPETKQLRDSSMTRFRVCTSREWTGKDGEKQKEETWHTVTCWGALAKIAAKNLSKGRRVFVVGRIRHSKYSKNGVECEGTETVCDELVFLDAPKGAGDRHERDRW